MPFQAALQAELTKGDSFAAARQRAVAALLSPSDAALLSDPNNTLGIEYCRALLRVGAAPALFTIPRTGAAHDATPENAGGLFCLRHSAPAGRRPPSRCPVPDGPGHEGRLRGGGDCGPRAGIRRRL